jgi:hypothetical protein
MEDVRCSNEDEAKFSRPASVRQRSQALQFLAACSSVGFVGISGRGLSAIFLATAFGCDEMQAGR